MLTEKNPGSEIMFSLPLKQCHAAEEQRCDSALLYRPTLSSLVVSPRGVLFMSPPQRRDSTTQRCFLNCDRPTRWGILWMREKTYCTVSTSGSRIIIGACGWRGADLLHLSVIIKPARTITRLLKAIKFTLEPFEAPKSMTSVRGKTAIYVFEAKTYDYSTNRNYWQSQKWN